MSEANLAYNDEYYRQRLRSLQAVDEMVEALVKKLEAQGILDNTYIIYTSDNGFHIGQHRLQPGKYCPYEEDINVPLLIRGPRVPRNMTTEILTTHTDIAPTLLSIIKAPLRDEFDGTPIPVTKPSIDASTEDRYEHVQVEFWGLAFAESARFRYNDLNGTFRSFV
jgi:arylsulfatase A-like enzyme